MTQFTDNFYFILIAAIAFVMVTSAADNPQFFDEKNNNDKVRLNMYPGGYAGYGNGYYPGGGYYNGPGMYPGGMYPGGAYPGGAYPGGAYPGGAYPGGAYPGGVYPGGAYPGVGGYPVVGYPVGGYPGRPIIFYNGEGDNNPTTPGAKNGRNPQGQSPTGGG